MKSIAICNQKGGVAKSTTAVTLGHGLALRGKRVLLIDLDPQAQLSTLLGVKQQPAVYEFLITTRHPYSEYLETTGREGLDLIPGDRETNTAQLMIHEREINYLKSKMTQAGKDGIDFAIFDTAPSVGDIQAQAIYASDYLLIPSATDFLSSEGVFKVLDTATGIKNRWGWRGELLGILPTFYDDQTNESKATIEDLTKHFGEAVLTPIHRATILRECAASGATIWELDRNSRAAREYQQLVDHVLGMAR